MFFLHFAGGQMIHVLVVWSLLSLTEINEQMVSSRSRSVPGPVPVIDAITIRSFNHSRYVDGVALSEYPRAQTHRRTHALSRSSVFVCLYCTVFLFL